MLEDCLWPGPEFWWDMLIEADELWVSGELKGAPSLPLCSPSLPSFRRNLVSVEREDLLRLWLRSGIVSTIDLLDEGSGAKRSETCASQTSNRITRIKPNLTEI